MPEDIGVFIEGAREVDLRFETFPQALHARLLSQISSLTARLTGIARAKAPKRTGKLASEIAGDVRDSPERIVGRVTVDAEFAKAGAEEYGAHRKTKVGSHEMRLDHVFGKRLNSPMSVMVATHSRQTNILERRFMRGSIEAMEPQIESSLREAVTETIDEGQ